MNIEISRMAVFRDKYTSEELQRMLPYVTGNGRIFFLAQSVNYALSIEPTASWRIAGSASSAVASKLQPLSDKNAIIAAVAARLFPSTNG
jgi:hypothetical protein